VAAGVAEKASAARRLRSVARVSARARYPGAPQGRLNFLAAAAASRRASASATMGLAGPPEGQRLDTTGPVGMMEG
jgi:hypothetical protein